MTVTIKFEDNDHEYNVDFLKLVKYLKITEQQVKLAVTKALAEV